MKQKPLQLILLIFSLILVYSLEINLSPIFFFQDTSISKEINLSSNETTIVYHQENVESFEPISYYFNLNSSVTIKISIKGDEEGEGKFIIFYKDSPEKPIEDINLVKDNEFSIALNASENIPETYYIEYEYSNKHNILIKFCFEKEEFYILKEGKNINEYYTLYNHSIYLYLPLLSYENGYKLPIKISGDFSLINENITYIELSDDKEKDIEEIIQVLDDSTLILDNIQVDKSVTIFYFNIKNNRDKVYLKINIANSYGDLQSTKIALINEEKFEIDSFFGNYSKYSGSFLFVKIDNKNINEDSTLIMHTNSKSILEVIGINSEKNQSYIFGNSTSVDGKIYKNERVSIINLFEEKTENEIDTYIFVILNSKEDFSLQIIIIPNPEYDVILNNFYSRKEYVNFKRETFESRKESQKIKIIINQYEIFKEKYIYYDDKIYGNFSSVICDIDSEVFKDNLLSKNSRDPHLVQGSVELLFFQAKTNFGINSYMTKCEDFNGKNINQGDFIQICLEKNKESEINMPEGKDIDYKISLIFYENTGEFYSVDFNDMTNNETLNNSQKVFRGKWDNSHVKKLKIKNRKNNTVMIFLKIIPKEENLQLIKNSNDILKLEPNTVYALILPKLSGIGNIYGTYQELFLSFDIENLCIFHEVTEENYISFPPKFSCSNYKKDSYEMNITRDGIYYDYIKNREENFYTYIYFTGGDEQSISLNYRHMIMTDKILEHETIFKPSKDIIYFKVDNDDIKEKNGLFLEVIKNKEFITSPIYIQSLEKGDIPKFKHIDIFDSSFSSLFGKIYPLSGDIDLIFKFYGTEEYLFYYQFGNNMQYNYIENNTVKGSLIEGTNFKYKLNFLPFEVSGTANYSIFIFNSSSNYTLDNLKNPFFIHNTELKGFKEQIFLDNIISKNGDFDEETKKLLEINLKGDEGDYFYILIIANKESPLTAKYYYPLKITLNSHKIEVKIELDNFLEKTKCFEQELIKGDLLVLNISKINEESQKDGSLVIQWISELEDIFKELNIFEGMEQSKIIYVSKENESSYLLDTKIVNDNFIVTYEISKNNKTKNKICLEYISSKGKSEYEESEIEYKYSTSINLPYYINTEMIKTNLEVFKLNYNKDEKHNLSITVNCYDNNNQIFLCGEFNDKNLIQLGNSYYFGVYSILPKKLIYINLKIAFEYNIKIDEEFESFSIKRIKTNDYSNKESKEIIYIKNVPQFYFLTLTERLKNFETLLFLTNLIENNGFSLFKGNYFSSNKQKVTKAFYIFNIDVSKKNDLLNNLITFVTYSEKDEKEGFVDLSIRKDETFSINENCDRETNYNKEITLNNEKGSNYLICYYSEEKDKKYLIKYEIQTSSENEIKLFYTNASLSMKSINNIFLDLENKVLREGNNNILSGNFEIFAYKYEIKKKSPSTIIKLKTEKYHIPDTDDNEDNGGLAALIIALVFIGIVALLIIIFFFCKFFHKNPNSQEIERSSSTDNPLMSEVNIIKTSNNLLQ